MKFCPKCGQEKDLDDFGRHVGKKHDRTSWCKVCTAAFRVKIVGRTPEDNEDRRRRKKWRDRTDDLDRRAERVKQGEDEDQLDYVV